MENKQQSQIFDDGKDAARNGQQTPGNEQTQPNVVNSDNPNIVVEDHTYEYLDEDTKIKGWLSFFLFVTVGVGMCVSALMILTDISSLGLECYIAMYDVVMIALLLLTGISTIVAFCKRYPNAVALAKTYMFFVLIKNIVDIILSKTFGISDTIGIGTVNPYSAIVGNLIWILYLYRSQRVKRVIPKSIRKTGTFVKAAWALYAVVMILYVTSFRYFPDNVSKLYLNDTAYIEAQLRGINDASTLSVDVNAYIDGKMVVIEYDMHQHNKLQIDEAYIRVVKQGLIDELSGSKDLYEFISVLARNGFEMRYDYTLGYLCDPFTVTITNEELHEISNWIKQGY